MPVRILLLSIFVIAIGLANCGRKGPLDPPPGDAAERNPVNPPSGANAH